MDRYKNTKEIKSKTGKRMYATITYPEIPVNENDIYIITTEGDRLELLAYDNYKDTGLYWIIAKANLLPGSSMFLPPGIQLRIPTNIGPILENYRKLNN